MPPLAACPSEADLRALLSGELPEGAARPLEEHLLSCGQCLETTRRVQAKGDSLLTALQTVAEVPPLTPEALQKLTDAVREQMQVGTADGSLEGTGTATIPSAERTQAVFAKIWSPPQQPDELGRLGDFRILKLLGQGGMGAVFLAEDLNLRRPVALKLMHPRLAAEPESAARFLREAQSAAAVRNDHIVAIYQVGRANGEPFIAQELLEGESLQQRLRREPRLPVDETLRIAEEIALALAAAHAKGLCTAISSPATCGWKRRQGA